jgi:hypothetical protein
MDAFQGFRPVTPSHTLMEKNFQHINRPSPQKVDICFWGEGLCPESFRASVDEAHLSVRISVMGAASAATAFDNR